MLHRILPVLLCLIALLGCSPSPSPVQTTAPAQATAAPETQTPTTQETQIIGFDPYAIIDTMSTESLVGQLFLGSCPEKENAVSDITAYQPGGLVLFGSDIQNETPQSLHQTLSAYQDASALPLLIAVDEEGGTVVRISRYPQFRSEPFPSNRRLYEQGGAEAIISAEEEKCKLICGLGINVNLGPVCDITMDKSAFMYARSIGLPPGETGDIVASVVQIMASYGVGSVLKHFPGYGNNGDTHIGSALDNRSMQQLKENDLIPFVHGIAAECDAIMISHTVVSAFDETMPASLSPAVHHYIREEMGFDGILMTDDLIMDAISDTYGDAEAAVLAILAGNDMLCTGAFQEQYPAVLEAVQNGRIPLDTVRDAVARILNWKYKLGLMS